MQTGIEGLRLTTRDVNDYDVLMTGRLKLLKEHNLTLRIYRILLPPEASFRAQIEFVDWLRSCAQLIVVSDTSENLPIR